MTLERGLELLAGRRAWEAENGGVVKKGKKVAVKSAVAKKAVTKKTASATRSVTPKNMIKKGTRKKAVNRI
jgi:topoisomerase IA-like protein